MSKMKKVGLSPVLDALVQQELSSLTSRPVRKSEIRISLDDSIKDEMASTTTEQPTLAKKIMALLNGPKDSAERLAFESDPSINNEQSAVYKQKIRLIPDSVLKRIAIQDDLVAAIVQARCNQISSFGRPQPTRRDTGFVIKPKKDALARLDKIQDPAARKQANDELQDRVKRATKRLLNCGKLEFLDTDERLTFPTWLLQTTRSAIVCGRIATEIVFAKDSNTGEQKFHSFRVVDAGTIYRATKQKGTDQAAQAIRDSAKILLEQIKNVKLDPDKFQDDEYAFVQVIEGRPVQAFTHKELYVENFFPVPDVELDGYPVTPLDTVLSAVTTHINITTHNKLYFQSGRATRGMLVIASDDVDQSTVERIRQQFNASINSVNNAWRMPVFAVGSDAEVKWEPIDGGGGKDMEFQYLMDMNARIILSAFQMSPEELPGWGYLSKGTNNQALSESSNEYKMEAARDVGIRPLIAKFEDFLNQRIFPLIDTKLSELAEIHLVGLDAESAEKEATRLTEESQLHGTYNYLLSQTEQDPLPKDMAGDFPLNPGFQQAMDKVLTVGQQIAWFLGKKEAAQDPTLAFYNNPLWMQYQQMLQQQQQMQMQQQQAQAQAAAGGAPPQDGGGGEGGPPPDQGGGGAPPQDDQQAPTQQSDVPTENERSASIDAGGQDLTRALDQVIGALTKSEKQLPPKARKLLTVHRLTLDQAMKGMEEDLAEVSKEITDIAEKFIPRGDNFGSK